MSSAPVAHPSSHLLLPGLFEDLLRFDSKSDARSALLCLSAVDPEWAEQSPHFPSIWSVQTAFVLSQLDLSWIDAPLFLSFLLIGRKAFFFGTSALPIISWLHGEVPVSLPQCPGSSEIRFFNIPNYSILLTFVKFLMNSLSIHFSAKGIILWAMQLAAMESGSPDSPILERLVRVRHFVKDDDSGFRLPCEFAIVRYAYECVFECRNLGCSNLEIPISKYLEPNLDETVIFQSLVHPPQCDAPPVPISEIGFDSISPIQLFLICINDWIVADDEFFKRDLEATDKESLIKYFIVYFTASRKNETVEINLTSLLMNPPAHFESFIDSYFRDPQVTNLNADPEFERIIQFAQSGKRCEPNVNNLFFTPIELFRRYEENGQLTDEEFSLLVRDCHNEFIAICPKEEFSRELFLAGILESSVFVEPTKFEDVIYSPSENRLEAIFAVVFLAARLVSNHPEIVAFLDFFTNSGSGAVFSRTFQCVSKQAIFANAVEHIKSAVNADFSRALKALTSVLPDLSHEKHCHIAAYISNSNQFEMFELFQARHPPFLQLFANHSAFLSRYFVHVSAQAGPTTPAKFETIFSAGLEQPVYEALAALSLVNGGLAVRVLEALPQKTGTANSILKAIPPFTALTPEFVGFIRAVIAPLPRLLYQTESLPVLNKQIDWPEDPVAPKRSKQTIWDEPTEFPPCTRIEHGRTFLSQPIMFCYTCGIFGRQGVCAGCALLCHRGHDVAFYEKATAFYCDCFDRTDGVCKHRARVDGKIERREEVVPPKPKKKKTKVARPNVFERISIGSVVELIDRLMGAKLDKMRPSWSNRLTVELDPKTVKEFPFRKDNQAAHFEGTGLQVFERMPELFSVGLPLFMNLVSVSEDILIACEGSQYRTFSVSSGLPLQSGPLPAQFTHIAIALFDPSVIAFASSSDCYVFGLTLDGFLEERYKVELMLQSHGQRLHVISIEWVPTEPFCLAITTASFVKVYDVIGDLLAPLLCFHVRDRISSSFFTTVQDTPYIVIATEPGRVAVSICDFERQGPIDINKYVPGIKASIISYSPTTRLAFLSFPRGPLAITHIDALISSSPQLFITPGDLPFSQPLAFAGVHPAFPSFHIFRGIQNGILVLAELTDAGICASQLPNACRSAPISTSDGLSFLGFWQGADTFSIIGVDGYAYNLTPGSAAVRLVDFTPPPAPVETEHFTVPPTFWMKAERTVNDISVKDETGAELAPLVVTSRGSKVQVNKKSISLRIRSLNPKRLIVGVQIQCAVPTPMAVPKSIALNGRVKHIGRTAHDQLIALPLTQREVETGAPIVVDIVSSGSQISIVKVEPFVVNEGTIERPATVYRDWVFEGSSIKDFIDRPEGNCEDEAIFLVVAITSAEFREMEEGGGEEEEAVLKVMKIMYERPKIANACRRIILKVAGKSAALERIWAKAIREVCVNESVAPEMKQLLARDFSLLPQQLRDELGDIVWSTLSGNTGVWSLVGSLMC